MGGVSGTSMKGGSVVSVRGGGAGAGSGGGLVAQLANIPRMRVIARNRKIRFMTVLLLEALAAVLLFGLAIWWTMFAGRDKGELRRRDEAEPDADQTSTPADATPQKPDDAQAQNPADDDRS